MRKTRVVILTIIAVIFLPELSLSQEAQIKEKTECYKSELTFRREETSISNDYKNNNSVLTNLLQLIRELNSDTLRIQLKGVEIVGTASPEGFMRINRELSLARAHKIEELLLKECAHKVSPQVSSYTHSWEKVFLLLEQTGYQYTDEIKTIVKAATAEEPEDERRSARIIRGLKSLHNGEVWQFLDEELLPAFRSTLVTIVYQVRTEETPPLKTETPAVPEVDNVYVAPEMEPPYSAEVPRKRKFLTHLGVSTNLLYDAALVPNIGLEYDLGKHISLGGNWMYAWWKTDRTHYYWRIYGGDVNVQKWLGHHDQLFSGHHFGVYGQIVTYDFELGHRGYLADRWSYGGGLVYGYSWALKRRLRLDASLFAGYQTGEVKEYLPIDTHYVWQLTKTRNYVGPTQVQLSLVWLLDQTPCWRQSKKGGAK